MSWLLFLDESGHDHRRAPYEVHGGFAIHAAKLWPFISAVRTLQQSIFGVDLREYGLELKGSKLLKTRCFKWQSQAPRLDEAARRNLALNFLNNGQQGRQPRFEEFAAYGQACLAMAEGVIRLLQSHDARLFASVVPDHRKPKDVPPEALRQDLVRMLERYFYFLDAERETGLLVMDGTEKQADRQLVTSMERYFTLTMTGRQRTRWIVPVPLFVESDMADGVPIADLCIYCVNWARRLPGVMAEPTRPEIEPFAWLLDQIRWRGRVPGTADQAGGFCFVPDPYTAT